MSAFTEAIGSAWTWIVAGLALILLELAVPGVFLVWLGLAALLTGLLDAALAPPWQADALVFAGLAPVCVLVGRWLTGRAPPPLKGRGEALVGQVLTLDRAIEAGAGRVRVGDSSWRALGPEAPAGARVRVVGVDGTNLLVILADRPDLPGGAQRA